MGKTDPDNAAATAAVDGAGADGHAGRDHVRPLTVFGYDHAPHGHGEVDFKDVRVPPPTSCSAKAAASRSPRAASARAASTTACA
jgi:hypothetical protein